MRYLLDTTDLIDLSRRRRAALEFIERTLMARDEVYTSAMNVAELYGGIRPGEEDATANLLDDLLCLPVTREIAQKAGELKAEWSRKGRTLGLADMMVAATALQHGLTLVTQNRKDFPIEGLALWP